MEKEKERERKKQQLPLICSLTCGLKAGDTLKMYFIRIFQKMNSVVRSFEAAHISHLPRVNDHPNPWVQKRKDRPPLDTDRLLTGPETPG